MAGRQNVGIRETRPGATEFMLGESSRRAARDGVRASVVATKRVTTVERRERRNMKDRCTGRRKTNRCECLQRLCRRGERPAQLTWRTPPEGRRSWRPREERALSRPRALINRRAGCGKSARPVRREGERCAALPTPIGAHCCEAQQPRITARIGNYHWQPLHAPGLWRASRPNEAQYDEEIARRSFQPPLPPLIRMDESVRKKIDALFQGKP